MLPAIALLGHGADGLDRLPYAADQPGERELLEFETLTRAPIDLALVEASLLTDQEIAWLNDYHAAVRRDVGHRLAPNVADWLAAKTAPVRR